MRASRGQPCQSRPDCKFCPPAPLSELGAPTPGMYRPQLAGLAAAAEKVTLFQNPLPGAPPALWTLPSLSGMPAWPSSAEQAGPQRRSPGGPRPRRPLLITPCRLWVPSSWELVSRVRLSAPPRCGALGIPARTSLSAGTSRFWNIAGCWAGSQSPEFRFSILFGN